MALTKRVLCIRADPRTWLGAAGARGGKRPRHRSEKEPAALGNGIHRRYPEAGD